MKVLFINQSRNLGGAEKLLARIVENIGLDSVVGALLLTKANFWGRLIAGRIDFGCYSLF